MSLYSTMMDSVATALTRPTIARGAQGGVTQAFVNVLVEEEICSVQPANSDAKLLYAQRGLNVNVTVYFTRDIGAEPNDVLDVTDDAGKFHRFLVHGFNTRVFNRLLCPYELHCEERPYPTTRTGA